MSLANDAIYKIRASLGDIQGTRWPEKVLLDELDSAMDRMLAVFKRNTLDYGHGKAEILVAAGADEFDLPADFRGVVGLYHNGKEIKLYNAAEMETVTATAPLVCWAVDGDKGVVKNAPTVAATVRLRYWQRPPAITQPASVMPWGGIFDRILISYAKINLANYDEMNVSQDIQIVNDFENNMLTLAISRNRTSVESKGWLS